MLSGYRTIIANIAIAVAAITGNVINPELVNSYLDAIFLLWGGVNVGLRFITSTPIFRGK